MCRTADVLVAAIGRPGFVTPDFVKPGATVIDVGINRLTDGAEVARFFAEGSRKRQQFEAKGSLLIGDVHPDVEQVAGAITPVPGGVGPLTIAMVLAQHGDGGGAPGRARTLMLRVALTGGIATGKSYVAQRFRQPASRSWTPMCWPAQVVEPGTPALRAIVGRFGADVLDRTGALNRPTGSRPSSSRTAARGAISRPSSIRPFARASIGSWLTCRRRRPFAVADIPLLFETGASGGVRCGRGRGLSAGDADRTRDGAGQVRPRAQAEQRMAAQWPIDDKVRRADYVIDTASVVRRHRRRGGRR